MSVIALVLVLLFLAGILWLVKYLFPGINSTIYKLIVMVIVIVAILLVLNALGVWEQVRNVKVPKL